MVRKRKIPWLELLTREREELYAVCPSEPFSDTRHGVDESNMGEQVNEMVFQRSN